MLRIFLLCTWFFVSVAVKADVQHLLPRPIQMNFGKGVFRLNRPIELNAQVTLSGDADYRRELEELIVRYQGELQRSPAEQSILITKGTEDLGEEGYTLSIQQQQITIKANTAVGAFYAAQTLLQLAEGRKNTLPVGEIRDVPAWKVRGYMHDTGRTYIDFEVLKRHIRLLSRYKINTFHWHITDNQGWRLESKVYPQLNAKHAFNRHEGKFYTIAQAQELVRFARAHGVTVIPEIDMPGHSEAFRKAMGHSMLTPEGLEEMKAIMEEACETFRETEWMHIGTDELRKPDLGTMDWTEFIPVITRLLHSKGKKVMSWNPGYHHATGQVDMTQMWSSAGRPTPHVPAIDSRYFYINHFDQYADIVGLYHSNIAGESHGNEQYAGIIIGIWTDRILPRDEDIVLQNAFYASMLATAERAWRGGGTGYITQVGTMLPTDDRAFADWEERFLWHKAHHLQGEPIAYVRQTNVHWRITDAFPNGGDITKTFPPEELPFQSAYTYQGKTYGTSKATGAGIYLRHVWGKIVPAFFAQPQENSTVYAYTTIESDKAQTVGVQIETQNYSRSESDLPAPQGMWDENGSQFWLNGQLIPPPVWENCQRVRDNETLLRNENFTARPLYQLPLKKGRNTVLIKLPITRFSSKGVRLKKWMFTFVCTTPDGKEAAQGIRYIAE